MKSLLSTIILTITLFVSSSTFAQQPDPITVKAIQKLMRFEGYWEGPAIATIDGKTFNFTYSGDFNKTADGNGLYMNEHFSDPDLGTLFGANLIGYDPQEKNYKWFSVDNMGTCHTHVGQWKTDDDFYMEFNGLQDGKKYEEKIDMQFKSKDLIQFKLDALIDGQTVQTLNVNFSKKAKPASQSSK